MGSTPILSVCHGIFTDWSIFSIPFLSWRSICFLWLVMALPRASHSKEVRSKNNSVYESAVTGIQWSCLLLVIGSWCFLNDWRRYPKNMTATRGPFLESDETFWAHFGWHNSLCNFTTTASRGTKLCIYLSFYSLYNVWKDQLNRISWSESYGNFFASKTFSPQPSSDINNDCSLSAGRFCQRGRPIAEEKLGRHWSMWRDLFALRSRHCFTTVTQLVVLILFTLFSQFLDLWLFWKRQKIFFSKATFKYCFQLTRLLFCWMKTRLEIQNLITIGLS